MIPTRTDCKQKSHSARRVPGLANQRTCLFESTHLIACCSAGPAAHALNSSTNSATSSAYQPNQHEHPAFRQRPTLLHWWNCRRTTQRRRRRRARTSTSRPSMELRVLMEEPYAAISFKDSFLNTAFSFDLRAIRHANTNCRRVCEMNPTTAIMDTVDRVNNIDTADTVAHQARTCVWHKTLPRHNYLCRAVRVEGLHAFIPVDVRFLHDHRRRLFGRPVDAVSGLKKSCSNSGQPVLCICVPVLETGATSFC